MFRCLKSQSFTGKMPKQFIQILSKSASYGGPGGGGGDNFRIISRLRDSSQENCCEMFFVHFRKLGTQKIEKQ
jgi:hypothetical protein